MKRKFSFIILMALWAISVFAGPYEDSRKAGIEAFKKGKYEYALKCFESVLGIAPPDNDLTDWIAKCKEALAVRVTRKRTVTKRPEAPKEVVVKTRPDEDYEWKSQAGDGGLTFVRHKGKYGVINNRGEEVVPLKYDEIMCDGGSREYWSWGKTCKLVSVAQHGKWGYINQRGTLIVPMKYDRCQSYVSDRDTHIWVKLNGLYGCIDPLGNVVTPIEYEKLEPMYDFIVYRYAKKNGKYGFIDKQDQVVVPFKYSYTRGFFGGMAPVGIGGKYGYMNKHGEEVIPLQYDFADSFSGGLAGVVKGGKLGFIDTTGRCVIPFEYEPEYSEDGNGKCLSVGASFLGPVVILRKGGKYGVVDRNGKAITSFKYDAVRLMSSSGDNQVALNGKTIYLDKEGNEYESEKDRAEKRTQNRVQQERPEAQYEIGRYYYRGEKGYSKDYVKAFEWFRKAANGGSSDAAYYLGIMYYYGEGVDKSYEQAFQWFSKASVSDNCGGLAAYYLGWQYEHGQGVKLSVNEALKWYKASARKKDTRARDKLMEWETIDDEIVQILESEFRVILATGTVEDNQGILIGCSVLSQKGRRGVATDLDGKFSFFIAADDMIQFAYVGYKTLLLAPAKNMKVKMRKKIL